MSAPAVCQRGATRGQMRLLSPKPGLKTVICGFGRAKDSQSLRTCGWWRYAMGRGELFRASLIQQLFPSQEEAKYESQRN